MSSVSAWTLVCSMCDSEDAEDDVPGSALAQALDLILEKYGHPPSFRPVQEHYGGSKHPGVIVLGAGLNHARRELLARSILAREWEHPADVVLVVHDEAHPDDTAVFRLATRATNL